MRVIQVEYLADHPELAPLLAHWHFQEWSALLPEWSLERALAELQSHTGRRQIPTTFVALDDKRPIGSASLLKSDLDGWEHLSPWVASVFVTPNSRGLGQGARLVNRVVEEAKALGVSALYLFTTDRIEYYQRLGFEPRQFTAHHGRDVVIMQRRIE